MKLTKEELQQQITELEARRDQLLAEANMAQGGALVLRGMLERLQREEAESPPA